MLTSDQKRLVRAYISGRVQDRDVVVLADELAALRKAMPIIGSVVEGMDISTALRAEHFNRAYEINGRKTRDILYRRRAT